MTPPAETPDPNEVLLIRLGESGPGFPAAADAVRILEEQTTTSPHKLALLPTRVKPAARAEGGPILLESEGKALAEAVIVRVDARKDFGPEMREQWTKAGLEDSKAWVIVKGFKRVDLPLDDVAETADGKPLDRTVGNRQFRWKKRKKPPCASASSSRGASRASPTGRTRTARRSFSASPAG